MSSPNRSPGGNGQHSRSGPQARSTHRSELPTTHERDATQRSVASHAGEQRSTSSRRESERIAHAPALHVEREGEAELQALGNADGPSEIDETQRREMIATSAYLRAERRGFDSGSELADWLAAEEEVDAWLHQIDRGAEEPPLFEE